MSYTISIENQSSATDQQGMCGKALSSKRQMALYVLLSHAIKTESTWALSSRDKMTFGI